MNDPLKGILHEAQPGGRYKVPLGIYRGDEDVVEYRGTRVRVTDPAPKGIKRETAAERKALPIASGVLDYFPEALLAVAEVSRIGNEQHHPGKPLHWDKSKSTDEADALLRHLIDRGTRDADGVRHTAKVAWRALALLQRELDAEASGG